MAVLGVRHRRFHTKSGLALLLAGVLTAAATTQGFVRITGSSLVDVAARGIGLQGDTGVDYTVDDQRRIVLVVAALGFLLAGCLLLLTRVRGIGVIWRLTALACLLMTAVFVAFGWTFINDPSASFTAHQSLLSRVETGGFNTARAIGAISVQPGPGLYLLTAATVIALVGVLVPAVRRTEGITRPEHYLHE